MIKKQLLCFGVLLLALMFSNMVLYSIHVTEDNVVYRAQPHATDDTEEKRNNAYYASLTFATEDLPLGDAAVKKRMMRYLKAYAFTKLRTHQLHRKAEKWFPVITPILRQYGIPEDFRYLPLIESGFQTGTSSHRGASGYWQFMPQTAKAFGLEVTGGTDERQDIRKSTVAACKYLKTLYREFNSWTLVAAAFNVGEGNLQRAIAHQSEDNFFKLSLNAETSSYIYKLISVKEIIENPAMHGYRNESGTYLAKQDEAEKATVNGNM